MEKISIPDSDIAPLEHIAEGVRGLRIGMVNVFAVSAEDGEWALIDAGLPHSSRRILSWVREHFGQDARPGLFS